MDRPQIEDILKRLGFFHVQEIDRGDVSDFCAGHIASTPFVVLTRDNATGALSGAYADLLERLAPVVLRYAMESDDIVMLPPDKRQAWISDLAHQAQLTPNELQAIMTRVRG